jgi:hypothetical protein
MSTAKQRLRDRSEHHLMQAAIREIGAGAPGTVKPYRERGGLLWRFVFVPIYRRVPWTVKQRAMTTLQMTSRGWSPPPREGGEPWRPPRSSG